MRAAVVPALCILLLAACKPPAADHYVARVALDEARSHASEPLPSPDTEGALWVPSDNPTRILFGKPGAAPLFALACEQGGDANRIHITRFVAADPRAKAVLALVGNGHAVRLPVDATWNGRAWLWEGYAAADDPELDVLTGPRTIEATIPGAGTAVLNPSRLPGQVIDACLAQRPDGSNRKTSAPA